MPPPLELQMIPAKRQLDMAFAALNRGHFEAARSIARAALEHDPHWVPMHFVAGVAALEQNDPVEASSHLKFAVESNGAHAPSRLHLARAHAMLQEFHAAILQTEEFLALAGDDPLMLDGAGVILTTCGEHGRALSAFQKAAKLAPDNAGIRYNLGTALTTHGDLESAKLHLEACIELDPGHWRAHNALAHLQRQTLESNHISRLKKLLQQLQGRVTASLYVGVALAKELEDIGEYREAFKRLTEAKKGPGPLLGYTPEKSQALFDALSSLPLPAPGEAQGHESDEPIFVVGMPRTGTTLVDRILSTHPQVTQAGELHNFASAFKQAAGGQTFNLFSPMDIRGITKLDWRTLGQRYIESTRPLTGRTSRFTDKLPHNFLYAGLIATAFPRAKIICVLRNPMDTCLSNFRQLFAPDSPYFDYSYDILHIGEYYIRFRKLMTHWRMLFPERILEIDYESIVLDQERSSRRLLEFCGLPWDPSCLRFELNDSPVATASAMQVRQPIYRSALGRWKRYEPELQPLVELLSTAGIHLENVEYSRQGTSDNRP